MTGLADNPSPVTRPLHFDVRDTHVGVRIVALSGELDMFTAGLEYASLVDECIEIGHDVVVDLSELTFMDSTGLALLLRLDRGLRSAGAQLVVTSPQPEVLRMFETTGVSRLLDVVEDVGRGLAVVAEPVVGDVPQNEGPQR